MQSKNEPAAAGKKSSEKILLVLLILLAAAFTVRVFLGREYDTGHLICHSLIAVLSGLFFGRRREKKNWTFFLAGAILLGLWSFVLIGFDPRLRSGLLLESLMDPFRQINTYEYFILHQYVIPYRESTSAAVIILLEGVYLTAWTARFCSARKRGALLRFGIFLTLPVILLPLSLTLIAPFLSVRSWRYGSFMTPALLTSAGIALFLIVTVLVLSVLKVRFGWKRLLISYGILILISISVWGLFFGIQTVRRIKALNRLASEGRPMTLDAFYARQKNVKDGTEKISELFDLMKNPEFDTADFPNNSSFAWNASGSPQHKLKKSRKEQMIRVSESSLGEQLTADLAGLAKYNLIRIGTAYTDFNAVHQVLLRIRILVRTGTGRAAIAHYLGKTEEILPRLKALTPMDRLLQQQPWRICALEHCSLDLIVVSQVLQLGPSGPQYADDYRYFLNWIRRQDYNRSWCQTEVCGENLRHYAGKAVGTEAWVLFLIRPLLIGSALGHLRRALRYEKFFSANRELPLSGPERSAFLNQTGAKGIMETALALKLYRSMHGTYPRSAASLVPEILPELPLDPGTGKPFRYELDGGHFKLFSESSSRKMPLLQSRPNY